MKAEDFYAYISSSDTIDTPKKWEERVRGYVDRGRKKHWKYFCTRTQVTPWEYRDGNRLLFPEAVGFHLGAADVSAAFFHIVAPTTPELVMFKLRLPSTFTAKFFSLDNPSRFASAFRDACTPLSTPNVTGSISVGYA